MIQLVTPYPAFARHERGDFAGTLVGCDNRQAVLDLLSVYDTEQIDNLLAAIELTPGPPGGNGADGASAYEIAVAGGFVGTEAEWLASLVGEPGTAGQDGQDGATGATGATGPNEVTAATATNLVGIFLGDGSSVSAVAVLPVTKGGTGGTTQTTAQDSLGVDSSATVTNRAVLAATNTFHDSRYRTQAELATGELSLGNKTLPNNVQPNDMSFDQSLYTKNQLCHCPLKPGGNITITVDGVALDLTAAQKLALVNGRNDYATIDIPGKPTTMEVVFDNGGLLDVFGQVTWQPALAMRQHFGYLVPTKPGAVRVLTSSDGVVWAEPPGGEWQSSILLTINNSPCWTGGHVAPQIAGAYAYQIRYVKFILTSWFYDPAYAYRNVVWFNQFCLRKNESPALPQFVDKSGDSFLGDMRFRAGLRDHNGSLGSTGQILQSSAGKTLWANPPTSGGGSYTSEEAQDAVGSILSAEFAYSDAVPSIGLSASVLTSLGLADSAVQPAEIADFERTTQLDARDAANRARSNHTGTQAAATITGLAIVATSGSYSDLAGKPDLSALNDVAIYPTGSSFPATGDTDSVYIATDTGYMFRWNGSGYTQLTDQTAIWGQISGTITNQTDYVSDQSARSAADRDVDNHTDGATNKVFTSAEKTKLAGIDVAASLLAYLAPQTLTDAATIAYDVAAGVNAVVTLGGDRTLGAITGAAAGQSGTLTVIQDGTGGRALALDSSQSVVAGAIADIAGMAAGAVAKIAWETHDGSDFHLWVTA